ncbi:Ribonuclease H2 subunit B [Leucoagaricus sp. SymC.cos]|nr:Ribonuclease H2 subunit B [Leucoagaricus sp. SymC.cos]
MQAVNPVDSRSWFLENEIVSDGKLMLMTPVDPVFLLIPILLCIQPSDGSTARFQPLDDLLEEAALALQEQHRTRKEGQVLSEDVLRFTRLKCTRDAFKHICDVKEITEEITVYRYSPERTLEYLRLKAARLSSLKTLELSKSIVRDLAKDGLMEDGKEELLQSGQLKAACDLVGHYLSPGLRKLLYASFDFTKLDTFLKNSAAEAMALTTVPQNSDKAKATGKSAGDKKRKAAKASHGVESLKKANVSGMAKLSSFFKKAEKVSS